jgi:hypothetical protein
LTCLCSAPKKKRRAGVEFFNTFAIYEGRV